MAGIGQSREQVRILQRRKDQRHRAAMQPRSWVFESSRRAWQLGLQGLMAVTADMCSRGPVAPPTLARMHRSVKETKCPSSRDEAQFQRNKTQVPGTRPRLRPSNRTPAPQRGRVFGAMALEHGDAGKNEALPLVPRKGAVSRSRIGTHAIERETSGIGRARWASYCARFPFGREQSTETQSETGADGRHHSAASFTRNCAKAKPSSALFACPAGPLLPRTTTGQLTPGLRETCPMSHAGNCRRQHDGHGALLVSRCDAV